MAICETPSLEALGAAVQVPRQYIVGSVSDARDKDIRKICSSGQAALLWTAHCKCKKIHLNGPRGFSSLCAPLLLYELRQQVPTAVWMLTGTAS
jgi:hypothetical protein